MGKYKEYKICSPKTEKSCMATKPSVFFEFLESLFIKSIISYLQILYEFQHKFYDHDVDHDVDVVLCLILIWS